jgi:hypothetical protein
MLKQQTQELAGDVAGSPDDGDFHRGSIVASRESRVEGERTSVE